MTFSTNDFPASDGLLRLPEGIRALPDGAFADRGDLRRAELPPGLTHLGEEVFSGCVALETVLLPEDMTVLGPAAFVNCTALRDVTLPPGLEVIGPGAFLYCGALKRLRLPPGLREVGELAFCGTGLEEVALPATVERVGESAFWDCAALRYAEIPSPDCQLAENVFGSCDALCAGYIAPGYPPVTDRPAELLYTLLWCSCPERHGPAVSRRAESFIRENESVVLDWVLRQNNALALGNLAERGLLRPGNIPGYVRRAQQNRQTELTALLLRAAAGEEAEEDWSL